jgi:excisionase family DNA binding protein
MNAESAALERLLTPHEAARLMGVSVHTLSWYRRVRKGPRFLRVGRHARYAPADLRAYMAAVGVETADSARLAGR